MAMMPMNDNINVSEKNKHQQSPVFTAAVAAENLSCRTISHP